VTVKLHGGLGNQLFQYAFGQGLAAKTGRVVNYDNTDCTYFKTYQLNAWSIPGVNLVHDPHASQKGAPWWGNAERVFHEPADHVGFFHSEVYDKPENTLFRGYWQTEQYFTTISDTLRQHLSRPNGEMPEEIKRLADEIQSSPKTAFICVRRGDYMTPALIRAFGCMNKAYYLTGRRHIENTVGFDTKFYVFSDDPAYCAKEFGASTIINHHQPNKAVRLWPTAPWDLYLMSLCQHGVISNSSFAWWGAFLGDSRPDSGRVVIAPDPWFQKHESDGVVPARWMRQEATIL
jgi:Glycosyl transferase family 11